jgi:DNA/RNA-binding domain of Phe-tRNA-synthetase-like protein
VDDPDPRPGAVAPDLVREFGPLELWHTRVRVAADALDEGRERLGRLSGEFRPVQMVRENAGRPVLEAYRAFERGIGLDPATPRTRVEYAARESLAAGRLASVGAVPDALLSVLVMTGVPVWALDAKRIEGDPGLRLSAPGERLGEARRGAPLPPGSLVVADARAPLAPLLHDPPERLSGARARDVVLYAVGVEGVPLVTVTEAVWTAARFLRAD